MYHACNQFQEFVTGSGLAFRLDVAVDAGE